MKSLKQLKSEYIVQNLTAFCPGCGNGMILNCFVRAIDELGIPVDSVLSVAGIGCSAWIPSPHFRGDTLHTTHGRAIAFATGVKLANPSLNVVVVMGDGDAAAIGGNHLLHAARRNIDVTALVLNNSIYAMTGGQVSPAMPYGDLSATTPYGNIDPQMDICGVAIAAGATHVARWTTFHHHQLAAAIRDGMRHHGFSLVEAVFQCPVQYGEKNRKGTAAEMLRSLEQRSKLPDIAGDNPPPGTIVIGQLACRERPEYGDAVAELRRRAAGGR